MRLEWFSHHRSRGLVAGLLLFSMPVLADHAPTHQATDGLDIYLGMIPAEVIQGRPPSHEARMHGGLRNARSRTHLVVALFDKTSGKRISDAEVTASIYGIDPETVTKALETMQINGLVTYGNYFALPKRGNYRVRLRLSVPSRGTTNATFDLGSER